MEYILRSYIDHCTVAPKQKKIQQMLHSGVNTYINLNVHRYKGSIPDIGFVPSTVYLDPLSLFIKEKLHTLHIFISNISINIIITVISIMI